MSSDNPTPSSTREFRVLTELNAAVHTLTSVVAVLDDINTLVSPTKKDSIYTKQGAAIASLRKWEELLTPNDGSKKSDKEDDVDTEADKR